MRKKNKSDALFVNHILHTTTKQDEVEEVDDLFADIAPPTLQFTTSLSEAKSKFKALESTIPGRTRTERFHTALLDFHRALGKDMLYTPRRRTFVTLLQLADTKDDLEKIIRLFPLYKITYAAQRIDGGKLGEEVVEAFIHRCTQLCATDPALQILGDYAKYRVDLTLPSARTLLHTLSETVPLTCKISPYSHPSTRTTTWGQSLPTCLALHFLPPATFCELKDARRSREGVGPEASGTFG